MATTRKDAERSVDDEPSAERDDGAAPANASCLVIGVGASAGGLAAFEAFFSGMPADSETGMAFVLVQHLAPDHPSILSELVGRSARMPVFEAEHGMPVRPNSIYVIRPKYDLALCEGTLRLSEPEAARGRRLPIDFFFRSLAAEQGERAVCVVLSGTGSDGTLGLQAVKAAGGMVLAQNPESTEYDGMPRSAIATGLVDDVLPPAEMAPRLIAYAQRSYQDQHGAIGSPVDRESYDLREVFVLLKARTGHDFSQYKPNTISRRVQRRMAVRKLSDLDGYLRCLNETPAEVEALFFDLLIGVTSFFRDPEAFAALEREVIPQLLAGKAADSVLRVWVPGCSTGEEAYSLGMLLCEKLEGLPGPKRGLQIFATDIDARAIATARSGIYPASAAEGVGKARLERWFFRLEDGAYRVNKALREVLIFSEQDVARDPPFSNLDLISCRNLMIYLGPELHNRLVRLFHYALAPAGALFLGTSETVGELTHLFAATDRKAKLYRREDDEYGSARPSFASVPTLGLPAPPPTRPRRTLASEGLSCRELAEQGLLEDSPVAALVNARGELLYLHGSTGQYLQPAPGEASLNILKMSREGLRHDLTTALHQAVTTGERVFRPSLRIKTNGDFSSVNVTVRPVTRARKPIDPELFLVIFEPAAKAEPDVGASHSFASDGAESTGDARRLAALLQELRTKDEYLHATHEEMQTSNEELRSTNEELQSTNEEVQSTNEELETSKEELQSLNEELATVNAELQSKVAGLSMANNDLNNLLAGTGIGTVFVNNQLRIRRFTPSATTFVNLIQTDVGRPLAHVVSNLVGYDQLVADVQSVLETLTPMSVEVRTNSGAWYLLRVLPYRTSENVVEGAVITFTGITAVKDLQTALQESESLRRLVGAVRDAQDAITVQNLEGRILAWNPGAVRMYGWSEAEALAMNIRAAVPAAEREHALATVQRLSRAEVLEPFRTQRLGKNGQLVSVTLTATALVNSAGAVYAFSTTERGMPS